MWQLLNPTCCVHRPQWHAASWTQWNLSTSATPSPVTTATTSAYIIIAASNTGTWQSPTLVQLHGCDFLRNWTMHNHPRTHVNVLRATAMPCDTIITVTFTQSHCSYAKQITVQHLLKHSIYQVHTFHKTIIFKNLRFTFKIMILNLIIHYNWPMSVLGQSNIDIVHLKF